MKMLTKIFSVFFFTGLITTFASPAKSEPYFQPRAGAVIPVNGDDVAYSLGLTAGYRWTSFFATEATYSRLLGTGSTPDGDILHADGIVRMPLPFVAPYLSGGGGLIHQSIPGSDSWKPMILLGGGITVGPILFLSLGIGVTYAIVKDRGDYIEPAATIGLHF